MNVKFSVVIPLYNKEISISNTIQSVINQTFQNFEIVIVNDGSTDNSLRKVQLINDPRIRIISIENRGVSHARNIGVKESKYKWIAFLDGDDLWKEEYLEEMHNFILKYPLATLYGSNRFIIQSNGKINKKKLNIDANFAGYIDSYYNLAIKTGPIFFLSCTIVSRERFLENMFNESLTFGEDYDFLIRYNFNNRVAFLNKYLIYYRNNAENKAINRVHPFKKSIQYLVLENKYSSEMMSDPKFAQLINNLSFRYLTIKLLEQYKLNDATLNRYILKTRKTDIGVRKYILFLPYSLVKLIYAFLR